MQTGQDAADLLRNIPGVQSVQVIQAQQYALALDAQQELGQIALQVAQAVVNAGFKLYAMQPGQRDLETVFNEISR